MPTVIASLAVGLLVSVFQTVTSIQEQTLSFAPRIVAVGVVMAVTLPWTLHVLTTFSQRLFLIVAETGR
jgi:flagellar biosynthetic protein FliQ